MLPMFQQARPAREGPEIEWKERLPAPARLARICDSGEVVGVADAEAVRAELVRIADELLDPPVDLATRRRRAYGLVLLEARVARARRPPVHVLLPCGRRVAYVRDGSMSRPAGRRELQALKRGPARAPSLDEGAWRVLAALARARALAAASIARAARLGARAARRSLVRLKQAGLVLERDDGALWLSPAGHERLARRKGGKR
ncbi:MAG: hypothetical protein HY812_13555 [Planctomycetes bacterium]|nr:hypothetical protein [Planctomycetota bacterium]